MIDPRARVKYEFVRFTRGHGLDLAVNSPKAFPQFLPVRRADDPCFRETALPAIKVDSFHRLGQIESAKCDFIVACAVLPGNADQIANHLVEWLRCVRVGGHVCIYEPDGDSSLGLYLIDAADRAKAYYPAEIVKVHDWPAGGIYMILRKKPIGEGSIDRPPERREKTACVVRHGGIGDQLQAAFLFPQLKRLGYHLTVLTTERCQVPIAHDPHVDEWFVIDHDHVPANELPFFWETIARHYDKFVNLNESVEGTFLPPPGRPAHAWPLSLRQKLLDRNYAEFAAALAEIPFVPEGRFYPTVEEADRAQTLLSNLKLRDSGPVYVILWALSGSSTHKFNPHQDTVIKLVLERLKRAVLILTGDMACKILEAGWDDPRVVCTSGEWTLRETLTMARMVDLVIGPETGVLNSVAYTAEVKKVALLSHSSQENLTKHWLNTSTIAGRAACYPCHQLHLTSEYCPQEPVTGAALCQAGMSPGEIFYPIEHDYVGWTRVVQIVRAA